MGTKKKSSKSHREKAEKASRPSPETEGQKFLKLLPALKEAERQMRANRGRFASGGYQISRSTSEDISVTEMMAELEAAEAKVAERLDALRYSEVAPIAPAIAALLEQGSSDFFQGSRRDAGKFAVAARRALCRKRDDVDGADGEDEAADKEELARKAAAAETSTLSQLVSAFASEGYIACCWQLWAPARDGDAAALAELLKRDPWTVDEPGRSAQGYTNALQVACAGGHVDCVELLLKHGAIFRDADWQRPPRPYVCTAMLQGAGYFDAPPPPTGASFTTSPSDGMSFVVPQPAAGCAGSGHSRPSVAPASPPSGPPSAPPPAAEPPTSSAPSASSPPPSTPPSQRPSSRTWAPAPAPGQPTPTASLPPPSLGTMAPPPRPANVVPPLTPAVPPIASLGKHAEVSPEGARSGPGEATGGAAQAGPSGILYFQAAHLQRRRVSRDM